MIWLILVIVLVAIFGLGTIFKAAFWVVAALAVAVVVVAFVATRLLKPRNVRGGDV